MRETSWHIYTGVQAEFHLQGDDSQHWGSSEHLTVTGGVGDYEGPYNATPSWDEQQFDTNRKLMRHDFTVGAIVELEVGNSAGGLTLTI